VFKGIPGRLAFAAGLAAVVGLLVAGCGGGSSTVSEQELAKAKRQGRIERAEKEKERKVEAKLEKLEREIRENKRHRRQKELRELKEKAAHTGSAPPSSGSGGTSPAPPSGTDCGGGTIAGPETSCGFAINVRAEYESYVGSGSGYVEAWSEANSKFYDMYCTEGSEHECSGAISATVYWP
jgi:hypothetical protein